MDNGTPIGEHKGHTINLLGAGYNCPSLGIYGVRTEASVKRMITTRLKVKESAACAPTVEGRRQVTVNRCRDCEMPIDHAMETCFGCWATHGD